MAMGTINTPGWLQDCCSFSDAEIKKHCRLWWFDNKDEIDLNRFREEKADFLNNKQWYNGVPWYARQNLQTGESGDEYWDTMAQAEPYWSLVSWEFYELVDNNKDAIQQSIADTPKKSEQVIDIGVGWSWKIFDMVKKVGLDPSAYEYMGVDLSPGFLSAFKKVWEGEYWVPEEKIQAQLMEWWNSSIYRNSTWPIFFLGWSICNNNIKENKRIAQAICSWKWRDVWYQAFIAPSWPDKQDYIEQLEQAYTTKEMEQWILKGCEAMQLPVDKLAFCAEYVEWEGWEEDHMRIGVKFTDSYSEEINGRRIEKQAGDFCQVLPSVRFSRDKQSYLDMWEWTGAKVVETHENDGSVLVHLRTPKEPLITKVRKKRQGLNTNIKNGLYTVLTAATIWTAWYKVGKYQEKQAHQDKVEQLEDDFLARYDLWNRYQNEFSHEQKEVRLNEIKQNICSVLEYHYGVDITAEIENHIHYSFMQRIDNNAIKVDRYGFNGGLRASLETTYYTSNLVDYYLYTHRFSLLNEFNIDVATPNREFLDYPEALYNTFYYKGEEKVFQSVDKELWGYGGYEHDWKVLKHNVGIKYIDNKPYMVVWELYESWYVLESRDSLEHRELYSSPQYVICDIIKRGTVNFLTEQIYQYIIKKYGDGYVTSRGQMQLGDYLMWLYAEWFNLDYLISFDEYKPYENEKNTLDHFIKSYVIKDIWSELQKEYAYENVDFKDIVSESSDESFINLQERSQEILQVLKEHTRKETQWFRRSAENLIVKLLLTDWGIEKLDNTETIKEWIKHHHEKFEELGYKRDDLLK